MEQSNTKAKKLMKLKSKKLIVAVAMSGGVDSSVVAKMMVDEGHETVGLFLKLWSDPTSPSGLRGAGPTCSKQNRCCDYEALEDARAVAKKLNIPFYVINAEAEFKKEIVDKFLDEYKDLRTPNPCIRCNEYIKFDLLLKKALEIGCEKLATGHYARIDSGNSGISNFQFPISKQISNPNDKNPKKPKSPDAALPIGIPTAMSGLKAGFDSSKDQSYMLYRLKQNQLSKVLFPLGNYLKKDVRKLAIEWDLPVKEKPESQEICFFGDRDYREFLKRYLDKQYFEPGDIVDTKGNVLGEHEGLVNYTIGQRKGIAQDTRNKRQATNILYVTGFDVEKNQLIVGKDREVYSKEMVVSDLNWIDPKKLIPKKSPKGGSPFGRLQAKIRYRHEAVGCRIEYSKTAGQPDSRAVKFIFDNPQRAVTSGQSAVFYGRSPSRGAPAKWDEVIGGGIIQ